MAACSTLPPPAAPVAGDRSIDGRLSLHYKDLDSGKEDALSGRFAWIAHDDAVELTLLDPLGQSVARVRTRPGHSSITFRDGRTIEGDAPEALMQRTLGYALPLEGLGAWLDGHAEAGAPATTLDDGRLRQSGWTIRFTAADDAVADTPPRRIDLYYPGPPAEIELRLVVDQRSGP